MNRGAAACALVFCLSEASARGLPVLRLALAGDASQLGAGALDATRTAEADALRLDRPALLTDLPRPLLSLEAEDEDDLRLGGKQFWAGTRADGFRSRATLAAPSTVRGMKVAAALGGRFDTGELVLREQRDGILGVLTEKRIDGEAALAAAPFPWLRLGGEVGVGLGRTFGAEAVARIGPVDLGLVRRSEELAFDVFSPAGPRRKIQRPPLLYSVVQERQVGAATASLRLAPVVELSASADLLNPGDFEAQGTLRLWRMAFHARLESTRYAFSHWATTAGTDVAHLDLALQLRRLSVGTDLRLGSHVVHVGHLETDLATSGTAFDNGNVTGRKLLSLDADFELYLRESYAAHLQSDGVGWSWSGRRLGLSAGLWRLVLTSEKGTVRYGSEVVTQLAGHDVLPATVCEALGLSAGASYRVGKLVLSLALAQLVPYSAHPPGAPPPKAGEPHPTSTPAAPATSATYDGGRLMLLEVRRAF